MLVLSACGTGFSAQTNQVYQPAVGANATGEVDSLNTLLVSNKDGSATLSASLQNNLDADQTLSSVTVTTLGDEQLKVESTDKDVSLPPGILTPLGQASDAGGFKVVSGAPVGEYVRITYTFSESGELTVEAPVVARNAEYDKVVGGDDLAPSDVSGGDSAE